MPKTKIFLLALLLSVPGMSLADDWAAPQVKEVFSNSREFMVRVIPGASIGDTVGFKGAKKGQYARAQVYQRDKEAYRLVRKITLLNPVAPVEFFVSDRGFLVTLDNWHNVGYGKVVAIYGPGGQLVRAYELEELYSQDDISKLRKTVSSIWWRTKPVGFVHGDEAAFLVSDTRAHFIFDLKSGRYEYCERRAWQTKCRTSTR